MRSATTVLVFVVTALAPPLHAADPRPADRPTAADAIIARCVWETFWVYDDCSKYARDEPSRAACAATRERAQDACRDERAVAAAAGNAATREAGATKERAIETCKPTGERAFLKDLRCPDGRPPTFARTGNAGSRGPTEGVLDEHLRTWGAPHGKGVVDAHVVDIYDVTCGANTTVLYLDMYHCGYPRPWVVPAGFERPHRLRSD